MCGIGAVAAIGGPLPGHEAQARVSAMVSQLHHRGPDEASTRIEDTVAFAFTRLSLVGLSNGSQPLATDDGAVVLVANGEVYNHRQLESDLGLSGRMRTESDCEVLLHLYRRDGVRFLSRVRGMFAIILWDRAANKLVLARDRFGIKPLYLHRNARRIVLASEIKTLFADPDTPREVDWDAALETQSLAGTPRFSDPETFTWFKDIQAVPAASVIEIDLRDGSTDTYRYWELPEPNSDWGEEAFVTAYRDALEDSVAECATADSELGLFLSGGIDSAAVLALSGAKDIHTFSAVTAGTVLNGDVAAASSIAGAFGNPHHQVLFRNNHFPAPDQWERLLWLSETPLCGPEIYYKYELHRYARMVRPELRGMLLGAASDEFNGGYSVQISDGEGWRRFCDKITYLADETDRNGTNSTLWRTGYRRPLVREEHVRQRAGAITDTYRRYLKSEYLKIQQYNVWHEDRTAAGSGIEARVPFLDHRVVEISASVPEELRPQLLWDKQILRRAMAGILPESVRDRPKVPFFYGAGTAQAYRMILSTLQAEDGYLLERALAAPGAAEHLHADNMRASLAELDVYSPNNETEDLLRLVNLGLLADMARDPTPVADIAAGAVMREVQEDPESTDVAVLTGVMTGRENLPESGYDLAVETLLLSGDAGECYLVHGGQIQYTFADGNPSLLLLRQVLSGVSLGTALSGVDVTSRGEAIADLLQLIHERYVIAPERVARPAEA